MLFSSTLDYQIWDYNVSHRQLLIRSPKPSELESNVDLIFWGVKYISTPTLLNGLAVDLSSEDEIQSVPISLHAHDDIIFCYKITTNRQDYFIVCLGCKIIENQLNIFQSSLCYFVDGSTDSKSSIKTLYHS